MGMNLHELIISPGSSVPFHCTLVTDRLDFPAIVRYEEAPVCEGFIRNTAGILSLEGTISAELLCTCDRCTREFRRRKLTPLDVRLATELEDEENPDYFLLNGEELDLAEVLESCFILDMDTRFLCKEDCKGLCPRCGADLNEGPCSCKKEKDPRLAVLEQLLDDKE